MSQYTGSYAPRDGGSGAEPSTTDVARDEAANVGRSARDAGGHVAQTATDQARQVVSETGRQARDLLSEARGQAQDQASAQQQKAAQQLRTVADELDEMAAKGGQSGLATEIARQAADRIHGAASWLEQREPSDLLEGVRDFARRRPGTFLVGAAVAGLAAGRLTKGMTAAAQSGSQPQPQLGTAGEVPSAPAIPAVAEPAYPAEAAYPADPGPAPGYGTGTIPGPTEGISGETPAGSYYPGSDPESYRLGQP
jgi:hypothetical protein